MFNKIRNIVLQACIVVLAVFSCGYHSCDATEKEILSDPSNWAATQEPPKNVVSIHKIIKRRSGDGVEQTIKAYFEDDVTINKLQELDSSEILSITAVPISGSDNYNLLLNLTERGRKMWVALSVASKGLPMAFVVDGMMYRRFIPRVLANDSISSVLVDGPFDRATALGIQNQSKLNYYKKRK